MIGGCRSYNSSGAHAKRKHRAVVFGMNQLISCRRQSLYPGTFFPDIAVLNGVDEILRMFHAQTQCKRSPSAILISVIDSLNSDQSMSFLLKCISPPHAIIYSRIALMIAGSLLVPIWGWAS